MPTPPTQPGFAMSSPVLESEEGKSFPVIVCDTHRKPSTRLVSKTAENSGRAFYICSEKKSCDYFVWEDKLPASSAQKSGTALDIRRSHSDGSRHIEDDQAVFKSLRGIASNVVLEENGMRATAESGSKLAGRSLPNTPSTRAPDPISTDVPTKVLVKTSSSPSSMGWNNARERAMAKRRADLAARDAQSRPSESARSITEPDATTSISSLSTAPSTVIQTPTSSSVSHPIPRMDATTCANTANTGRPSLLHNSPVSSPVPKKAVPLIAVKQEVLSTPSRSTSVSTVDGHCPRSDLGKRKGLESEARSTEPNKRPCREREMNTSTQGSLPAAVTDVGPSTSLSTPVQVAQDPAAADGPTDLDNLLQQTRPEEWKYLSEGGANVVYVYRGWREAFKDKALRIKKRSPVVLSSLWSSLPRRRSVTPNDYWQDKLLPHVLRNADRDAAGLLPMRKKMRVDSLWIWTMGEHSKKDRPADRLQDQYEELESRDQLSLVVLTDNLIGGTGHIAIEIKPKAGFVPPAEGLDLEYVPIKTKACKYCMKRCVTNGQGDVGYGFCPIDLFSKDYAPRSRALQSLTEAWTRGDAGNNMKVFVDGEIIHSAAEAKPNANLGDYRDPLALARLVNNALTSSGVLGTLLYLQKLYDWMDIQMLARLASPEDRHTQIPFNEPLCIEPYATQWADVCCRRSGGDPDPLTRQKKINVRYSCMAYAIAAIFKDCSIMLRWPVERLSAVAEQSCTVKLVDLDLKPMKNLNKWWKQDRELCSTVLQRGMTVACGAGGIQGSDYRIFRFPGTWKPTSEAVPKRPHPTKANQTEATTAQLLAKAQSDNEILRGRTAKLERALLNIGVQVVEAGLQTR